MPGTKAGGLKAAATNKAKYGDKFYAHIGHKGGKNGHTGGFNSAVVGKDGMTGFERARVAGAKGGHISKRGPAKKHTYPHIDEGDVTIPRKEERKRLKAEIRALEAEEDWND